MLSTTHAQRAAGKKPVSHQAAVVLTARLSQRAGNESNKNEARLYADVGEIALISNAACRYSRYPEPEYFTDCKGIVDEEGNDPTNAMVEVVRRTSLLESQWSKYSLLGIVQTPGSVKGMARGEGDHHNGSTNVVHAGGTMTTVNTSDQCIETNQLVCWAIPEKNTSDTLPDMWDPKRTGSKFHIGKVHAVTLPLPYTEQSLIKSANEHGAIIGRAMCRSQPGGQLDLIMAI